MRKTGESSTLHFLLSAECLQKVFVSIHNSNSDHHVLCMARGVNEGQAWIGGVLKGWVGEVPTSLETGSSL